MSGRLSLRLVAYFFFTLSFLLHTMCVCLLIIPHYTRTYEVRCAVINMEHHPTLLHWLTRRRSSGYCQSVMSCLLHYHVCTCTCSVQYAIVAKAYFRKLFVCALVWVLNPERTHFACLILVWQLSFVRIHIHLQKSDVISTASKITRLGRVNCPKCIRVRQRKV